MIVLVAIVLLVLLVGVAVVVAAAGTAAASDGDGGGTGWSAAAVVPAVAAGVVVLLVVAVFGLGGLRSAVDAGGPGEEVADDAPSGPVPDDEDDEDDEPVALEGSAATYDGRVAVDGDASPLRPMPIVDGLATGDVVEVRATGFLGHAEGVVAQCARAYSTLCRNVVPVFTDGDGRVRVPYRVVETAPGSEVLVVEVDLDRGTAQLVFGPAPTRPVLSLRGETAISIRDAMPGDRVAVRRCDPDAGAVEECGTVGRPIVVGADGTASLPIEDAVGGPALLVLTGSEDRVLAEPLRLEAPPAAEVDLGPMQLLVGLGVALVLIGTAVVLIRTTDWRVPAEAATPFLDAAPLEP